MNQQLRKRLAATSRGVTQALAEASLLQVQAQSAPIGDLSKWTEAVSVANHARDLISQGEADPSLRRQVSTMLAALEKSLEVAQARADEAARSRVFGQT